MLELMAQSSFGICTSGNLQEFKLTYNRSGIGRKKQESLSISACLCLNPFFRVCCFDSGSKRHVGLRFGC